VRIERIPYVPLSPRLLVARCSSCGNTGFIVGRTIEWGTGHCTVRHHQVEVVEYQCRRCAPAFPEGSSARIAARTALYSSAYHWAIFNDTEEAWLRHAREKMAPLIGVVGEAEFARIVRCAWSSALL